MSGAATAKLNHQFSFYNTEVHRPCSIQRLWYLTHAVRALASRGSLEVMRSPSSGIHIFPAMHSSEIDSTFLASMLESLDVLKFKVISPFSPSLCVIYCHQRSRERFSLLAFDVYNVNLKLTTQHLVCLLSCCRLANGERSRVVTTCELVKVLEC